MSLGYTPKKV